MAELLEITMIISFGASWPLNVIKSYKSRTAKGKSLPFLCLILFGYVAGIASKFMNEAYMVALPVLTGKARWIHVLHLLFYPWRRRVCRERK